MSIDMNDTVAWRDEHHKLTSAIQIPIDIMSFELNLQKESKNKQMSFDEISQTKPHESNKYIYQR